MCKGYKSLTGSVIDGLREAFFKSFNIYLFSNFSIGGVEFIFVLCREYALLSI